MSKNLCTSAQKVQDALAACGVACQVIEMPGSTRTAKDAAQAVSCRLGQIAKSLVFKGKQTGQAVLVITSGANRVSEKQLAIRIAEPIAIADADFVREQTGFAIGGVPPVGHAQALKIFIDQDLFQYDEIWAAAGTPRSLFKLTPDELRKITRGQVINVTGAKENSSL